MKLSAECGSKIRKIHLRMARNFSSALCARWRVEEDTGGKTLWLVSV